MWPTSPRRQVRFYSLVRSIHPKLGRKTHRHRLVLETLEERQLLNGSASADYPFQFGAVHLRHIQASTVALRIEGAKRASSLTARSGQSFHPTFRVSAVDGPQSLRIAGQSSRRPDLAFGGHVIKKVVTSQLTPGTRHARQKGTTHALSTPAPTTVSRGGNVDIPSVVRHSTVKRDISAAQTSAVAVAATDKTTRSNTVPAITAGINASSFSVSAGVPATASEGTSITFAGSISGGTGPYTEFWNFGDGTTASGSLAPSHVYEESGAYTVLLCVTDGANIFATSTGTVTVAKVAPTVTLTGPSTGEVGSAVMFFAAAADPATADLFAGFTYKWNFGDGTTSSGTNQAPTHTFAVAGTYNVSVTATGKDGATSILATKAIVITTATIIPIDQAWLQSHGPAPYILNQAGATYQLQTNLTTSGTAFRITQNNITLDLSGHTVTYDNANPITVTNAGFETGNTSGWNMSQAPGATVAPAMLGMYGNWMLDFPKITVKQTFVSSPISIPQANIPYIAGIQAKSSAWGAATATLTVIDAVTHAILGTPQTLDPGGGPILTVTFTPTTTHPVVLNIDVQPNSGQTATVSFDYASLYRNNVLGVDLSYKQNVTIIDGTVTQGQGHSAQSPAICAYGALFALEGVTAYASGMSTNVVYGNWSTGATIKNCNIEGGLDQIVNRMAANAEIYLMASAGVIDIENNNLTGSNQNGIVVAGGNQLSSFAGILIKGNDIRLNSCWTNGYGIGIGQWCRNFEVADNTIIPVSGRGIIVDTNNYVITDGTIHDNDVEVQERGDLEYGQMGLIATGLRMRNWEGTISNLDVYNNTFAAQTGVGPGIPAQADFAAAGARLGLYNDIGQEDNCNITFQNNLFKAIVVKSDPSIPYNSAWGISFPRYDAGMGVKFIDNTCESNNIAVNFGDSDGINESDITMIGTTIVKSTEGQSMPFSSFMVGNWGSNVHDVCMIDTVYKNGAPSTPTFVSSGAKDISFGYTLTEQVVDSQGEPVAGAIASIFDASGDLVYSGTTGADGLLAAIPLVTVTESVAPGGNNNKPTITTPSKFTVALKSGSMSGNSVVGLTHDQSVQVVVQ